MDAIEVRTRCIEAAAKHPNAHPAGAAAGVVEMASLWCDWIFSGQGLAKEEKAGGRPVLSRALDKLK